MTGEDTLTADLAFVASWCGGFGSSRMTVADLLALYDALVAVGRIKRAITEPDELADALASAQRHADCLYSCRVRRDRRRVAA